MAPLTRITRNSGSTVPKPATDTPVWSETRHYDSAARPIGTTRTINEGGSVTLIDSQSYDSDGRPSVRTYPSNVSIQTLYAAYGVPGAIANGATGQIYWEATAQDAWGKTTAESYVDGTSGSLANYASTGQGHTANWSLNDQAVDGLTYGYDAFGNLLSQKRTAEGAQNTETYVYDALQRLSSATRTAGGAVTYGYTASGP